MLTRLALIPAVAILVALGSCSTTDKGTTAAPPPTVSPSIPPPAPPSADAAAPADYPGLHNVVAYSDGLYSGSVPYADEGAFETLRAMGIRTIISVDGAQPDLEIARAHGMRYVHLPIGYNGMTEERTLEIARAIRDLPGPIYVHCHHGKHRSAGAAGAAAVSLGRLTNDEAIARMKVSGTAPNYTGLFQCVNLAVIASPGDFDKVSAEFPERWHTTGLVQTMVDVDHAFEHLKVLERAGWQAPLTHPDLVPAAEAGQLADLLRHVQEDAEVKSRPAEFIAWMQEGSRLATELEDAILAGEGAEALSQRLSAINTNCRTCHVKYRDAIVILSRK